MSEALSLSIIFVLYASVGLFAVLGSIVVTQKLMPPRIEQIFYAGFLIAIAGFYIPFMGYFQADEAWPMELRAIAGFSALAIIGARFTPALILGYLLHGLWDFLHEVQLHGGAQVFEPGQSTAIPLAYGAFCAAFDFGITAYFYHRRDIWRRAWQPAVATA